MTSDVLRAISYQCTRKFEADNIPSSQTIETYIHHIMCWRFVVFIILFLFSDLGYSQILRL